MNTTKGFIVPLLLVIIAIVLAGGGAYVYTQTKQGNQTATESSTIQTTEKQVQIPDSQQQNFSTSAKRYVVKGAAVYFIWNSNNDERLIAGADANTFTVICTSSSDGLSYAKDTSSVYLNDKKVEGANPQTFTLLSQFDAPGWYGCPEYSKDTNHVYQQTGVRISNYPDSFTTLGTTHAGRSLFTDSHSIFYGSGILSTDAPHFTLFNYSQAPLLYAKDSRAIYIASPQSVDIEPIKDSDPQSFRFIGNASTSLYARDTNLVYYFGGYGVDVRSITNSGVDAVTLTLSPNASGGFSTCSVKDKAHVYVQGYNLVPGADPATFVITDTECQHGKDAKHQYNLNDYVPQGVG